MLRDAGARKSDNNRSGLVWLRVWNVCRKGRQDIPRMPKSCGTQVIIITTFVLLWVLSIRAAQFEALQALCQPAEGNGPLRARAIAS